MSKKWTPKELLYDLVAIQSDSFTRQEIEISKHVYALIAEQDYWKEHPELCGLYDGKDVIGRLIPWALRRGKTNRTVILTGHTDCVEIDSYGELKPFALQPDRLKEEMLKLDYQGDVLADLEDENWCFGRGTADMKGGDACILYELFRYAEESLCEDLNILFMGIHDEEHQAEGIMQSIGLLNELKEKYRLDYRFLINTEPALRSDPKNYVYVDGSIGKMLPGIVVKGAQAHVMNIISGLNSTLIASNIVRKIELNTDMCCEEFGQSTPPPVVLYMKDSKNEYNVSVPNYTEIYAHVPLTKNRSLPTAIEEIRVLCAEAAAETLSQFEQANCRIGVKDRKTSHVIDVMTFAELDELCRKTDPDYEEKKAALFKRKIDEVNSGSVLIQSAGFSIIEKMIEMAKHKNPLIVIGLLPPYVPPVNNHYMKEFNREGMIEAAAKLLRERFDMGMSDNSYTSCTEVEQDMEAMRNMVTPKELYTIPFAGIARVAMPSVLCGPWGKDFHTATERVYLPDIEVRTPAVVEALIAYVDKGGENV